MTLIIDGVNPVELFKKRPTNNARLPKPALIRKRQRILGLLMKRSTQLLLIPTSKRIVKALLLMQTRLKKTVHQALLNGNNRTVIPLEILRKK